MGDLKTALFAAGESCDFCLQARLHCECEMFQTQKIVPQRSHRPSVRLSICVPGSGSGCVVHVHEHRRHLHQLPVGPGSASGLPGDAALHRGSAATGDGEPETGESAT